MKIFAYGLLKSESEFFKKNLKEHVIKTEFAYIQGVLHKVKGEEYSGAVASNGKVDGMLLTFENDSLLSAIDEYEDEGKIYERKEYDVYTFNPAFPVNDLTPETAWVYFLKPEYIDSPGDTAGGGCGTGCSSCG